MGRAEEASCFLAAVQTLQGLRAACASDEEALSLLQRLEREQGRLLVLDENGWHNELLQGLMDKYSEDAHGFFAAALGKNEHVQYLRGGGSRMKECDPKESLRCQEIVLLRGKQIASCERWGYGREGHNAVGVEVPDLQAAERELVGRAETEGLRDVQVRFISCLYAG